MKKKRFLKTLASAFAITFCIGLTSNANAAEIQPVGDPDNGGDITKAFSSTMKSNAAYMAQYALYDLDKKTYPLNTGIEFASRVKSGAVWDYKGKEPYKSKYFKYDGATLVGEDIGNMHYGFVGRGAGFDRETLSSAAGAYQICSGTAHLKWYATYFDDPKDQAWINKGMNYFRDGLPVKSLAAFDVQANVDEIQFKAELLSSLSEEEKLEIKTEFDKDLAENQELLEHNTLN